MQSLPTTCLRKRLQESDARDGTEVSKFNRRQDYPQDMMSHCTIEVKRAQSFPSLKINACTQFPELTCEQVTFFREHGYLVLEKFLLPCLVDTIGGKYESLFRGEFETGVYPDEWYGRPGISNEQATKEICNAWKSDRLIASVVLSSHIHRLVAQLHGWTSSRIAQDDVLWKPKQGGSGVGYHRDSTYISDQFTPREASSVTVWMPLDDVGVETGTLEYVENSVQWRKKSAAAENSAKSLSQEAFHSSAAVTSTLLSSADSSSSENLSLRKTDRQKLLSSGEYSFDDPGSTQSNAQVPPPVTFNYVQVPKGGVAFHHQDLVHGSGPNTCQNVHRRALVLHALNGQCTFEPSREPTYIYGRYKLSQGTGAAECSLHERFFPVCWSLADDAAHGGDSGASVGAVSDGNSSDEASVGTAATRSAWLYDYHCKDLPPSDLFHMN